MSCSDDSSAYFQANDTEKNNLFLFCYLFLVNYWLFKNEVTMYFDVVKVRKSLYNDSQTL